MIINKYIQELRHNSIPFRLFKFKYKKVNFVNDPILDGIVPAYIQTHDNYVSM